KVKVKISAYIPIERSDIFVTGHTRVSLGNSVSTARLVCTGAYCRTNSKSWQWSRRIRMPTSVARDSTHI
ncbi:hypothetical protein BpHYR1_031694, partial [Brachionus plicatilis]